MSVSCINKEVRWVSRVRANSDLNLVQYTLAEWGARITDAAFSNSMSLSFLFTVSSDSFVCLRTFHLVLLNLSPQWSISWRGSCVTYRQRRSPAHIVKTNMRSEGMTPLSLILRTIRREEGEFRLRPLFSGETTDGTHSAEGWLKHTASLDRDGNRTPNRPVRGYPISIYVLYRKCNVSRPHVYL